MPTLSFLNIPNNPKGVFAAPDYKKLYLELFRASEQAVSVLRAAQVSAERKVLDCPPPPLRLSDEDESGGESESGPTGPGNKA